MSSILSRNTVIVTKDGSGTRDINEQFDTLAEHLNDFAQHVSASVTDSDGVHGLKIEYGHFTPELVGSVVAGENEYNFRGGEYYRIGRLVKFQLGLRLSTLDQTLEGDITITGLPFARGGIASNYEGVAVGQVGNIKIESPYVAVGGLVVGSGINLTRSGNNVNSQRLTHEQLTNTSEFRVSGTYLTNL